VIGPNWCVRLLPVVVGAVVLVQLPATGAQPELSLRWVPGSSGSNQSVVEVHGLNAAALKELHRSHWSLPRWQSLLSVYAEQGDVIADMTLPAMLGDYQLDSNILRFEPRFALEPGLTYRATLRPDRLPGSTPGSKMLTAVVRLPARDTTPTTVVSQVYPSGDILPENLLKFYVHFSAPMSRGHIYDHIRLRGQTGQEVELPFLEIDEELWDPTMTRLTLFIDPGRIKRGVKPLEEIGPALEQGKRFTLVINQAWKDSAGSPLRETFQKTFTVGPSDRVPPDPADWIIAPPKATTLEPLAITFPEPMDHALSERMIRVVDASGAILKGTVAMENQERRWRFIPTGPWQPGPYKVSVQTTIEDLAGNNIGKAFEVDLVEPAQRRMMHSTVKLSFTVR
jgi:hypothetical protein